MPKAYELRIEYDPSPECPCHHWDTLYELFQGSRNYGHHATADQLNAMIDEGRIVAYGLNVYDHSGVYYWAPALDMAPIIPGEHYRWDVAEGGAVLMVREDAAEEYAGLTAEQRDANARGFLDEFNAWANGHVYGFTLIELEQCDKGEWHEAEDLGSVWGFYDDPLAMAWYLELPEDVTEDQITFTGDAGEYMGPEVWAQLVKLREDAQKGETS